MILDGDNLQQQKIATAWKRLKLPVQFRYKGDRARGWQDDLTRDAYPGEEYRLKPGETTCPESKASS